jgi:imidazolonepropionase-like amidohydrolase
MNRHAFHRTCLTVTLIVLLWLVAALAAQGPPEPLALTNARLVDVRTGKVSSGITVVLREGRIASLGTTVPPGTRTLDVRGKYLLPGLVDAHTHLSSRAAAERALLSGVTTVRSSGVSNFWDVGLRELVRRGALAGPDMIASGYHVRRRIAEEAFFNDPTLADLMGGLRTVDDLRRMVRFNLAHGVDWIKVLATERAGTADTDPRQQMFTEAELRAVVEEAATKNVPVQAHAHGDEGAAAAVRAGVRSIEHGTYVSDATLALMKERGTFLVPTFSTVVDLVEPGGDYDQPALQIRGRHMLPRLRSTVQHAHRLGVKIVTGADTSYGPTSVTRIGQEVANLVELGLPPLTAIQAATLTAAELLRLSDRIGAIEPGYEADLIAVDGNPLEDIRVLEDVLLVVSNGRVVLDRLDVGPTGRR